MANRKFLVPESGPDGSPSSPTYTFLNGTTTGLYYTGSNGLGLSTNGGARLTIDSSGNVTVATAAAQVLAQGNAGAASSPAYSFVGDTNTGIYSSAADTLNFATGGVTGLELLGTTSSSMQLLHGQGNFGIAGKPAYSFLGDSDTGMYSADANNLNFQVGGVVALNLTGTSVEAAFPIITATSSGTPTYSVNDGGLVVDTTNNALYFRSGGVWQTIATASLALGTSVASLPFTDGDTVKRVTITDSSVTDATNIMVSIRRPDSTDAFDRGYIYEANIVSQSAGSFDVLIAATAWGFEDPAEDPPNETIQLIYSTASSVQTPAGAVTAYAGSTAPPGWLLCQGQSVLRTDYPALFAAIGTTFGSIDGTHFSVPNLQGSVPLGVGTAPIVGATSHTLGQVGGEETHTLTSTESGVNPNGTTNTTGNHFHGARISGQGLVQGGSGTANLTMGGGAYTHDGSAQQTDIQGNHSHTLNGRNADVAHNNLPPYLGLYYIIKT